MVAQVSCHHKFNDLRHFILFFVCVSLFWVKGIIHVGLSLMRQPNITHDQINMTHCFDAQIRYDDK